MTIKRITQLNKGWDEPHIVVAEDPEYYWAVYPGLPEVELFRKKDGWVEISGELKEYWEKWDEERNNPKRRKDDKT